MNYSCKLVGRHRLCDIRPVVKCVAKRLAFWFRIGTPFNLNDLHVICHVISAFVFSVGMTASGFKYSEPGPKFDRKIILVMIWRLNF